MLRVFLMSTFLPGRSMPTSDPDPRAVPGAHPLVVLAGLLLLAVNLRSPLAGYPPLLGMVGRDLAAPAGLTGLVQSAVVLMMAAGSFAGSAIGARFGRERALGAAVALVAAGGLVRGVPSLASLTAGSVLVGLGLGVAGVLLAGVVKDRLPGRVGAVTGGYVVAMMLGSTVASAAAVPVARVLGGWSLSLAAWAVPALLAVVMWTVLVRRMTPTRTGRPSGARPSCGRLRRWAACYQGGTSLLVYGWSTWLPAYYASHGIGAQHAGLLLAAWSLAHIPAGLLVPALAERRRRWRFWSTLMLACAVTGTVGALLLPVPPVVGPWPWVVLLGAAGGAGFPLGLAVIAWRTPDAGTSAAVSGFALGAGYLAAGLGPLLMGLLIDATGGYSAAIALMLLAAAGQGLAIARIGEVRGPARGPEARAPSAGLGVRAARR
ncbi:CP family cyanate transporter-like MFS transporter [Saccharopolyspora erythraea NRRL 2338]|uniref:Cyanate MFS transporter n=3 Tax=Saccharopolyspora erythraea TaxID=1836 RepID=A4FHJ1_SACEN|nr:cyanate MFS transporter [Saccharopolyspora erythraea D]PFG97208.1 CP family cyanate transporter-like MFS transporter [Saccharopolyspora erythraea NRRL 2338]QRK87406.1 MFS transporter [Saccharopolyspora erythraea]CAM03516.1 cyanate MFS transporter [Saccharopolyspora erythraea NRRL 2338]